MGAPLSYVTTPSARTRGKYLLSAFPASVVHCLWRQAHWFSAWANLNLSTYVIFTVDGAFTEQTEISLPKSGVWITVTAE